MKKLGLLSALITSLSFLLIAATSNAKSTTGKEYQAIVDTAYNYFTGAATGDQTLLAKAFDMEFGHIKMLRTEKGSEKETIRSLTLKEFSAFFKAATKENWQAKVLSVDIVDDKMAMVKLNFETHKTHYIDYLVMYKRNGNWRIINKTFTAKEK